MTSINSNPIQYLTNQGLSVTLVNNQLNVKPANLVTKGLSEYIHTHKTLIKNQLLINQLITHLDQLSSQQQTWFYTIAEYLNYPAIELLVQEAIVLEDIIELSDRNPQTIATCLIHGGIFNRLIAVSNINSSSSACVFSIGTPSFIRITSL